MKLFFNRPKKTLGNVEEQIDSIRRALCSLSDDLEKILDNIDTDNLAEGLKSKIAALDSDVKALTKSSSQNTQKFERVIEDTASGLSSRITQTASAVESEVSARTSADTALASAIRQTAHSISLTTTAGASTAGITIRVYDEDGNQIDSESGNVVITGAATFVSMLDANNKIAGSNIDGANVTNIDGSHITTGTIDAARINAEELVVDGASSNGVTIGRIETGGGLVSAENISADYLYGTRCHVTHFQFGSDALSMQSKTLADGSTIHFLGKSTT